MQIAQDSVDSGATSAANLADRQDWADDDSFARGATLVRIRGSITMNWGAVANAGGAIWMALWLINDQETTPDPSNVTDYVTNDCLWSKVVNFATFSLTSIGVWSPPTQHFDVDVKAMRKLTSNSIVLMTWRATGGSSDEMAVMSALLRALIKKA